MSFLRYLFPLNAVAAFAINLTASTLVVDEVEGGAIICVEIITGLLGRDVDLELSVLASGTADFSDFSNSTLPFVFTTGSGPGTRVCDTVIISTDQVVEDAEDFSVELASASPVAMDVNITNSDAVVTIIDSPVCKLQQWRPLSYHCICAEQAKMPRYGKAIQAIQNFTSKKTTSVGIRPCQSNAIQP